MKGRSVHALRKSSEIIFFVELALVEYTKVLTQTQLFGCDRTNGKGKKRGQKSLWMERRGFSSGVRCTPEVLWL